MTFRAPPCSLGIAASVKNTPKGCFICCLLAQAISFAYCTYSITHSDILTSTLKLQFLRRRICISKTDGLTLCKKMTQRVCGGSYIDQHMSRTAVSSTHSPSYAVICRDFFPVLKRLRRESDNSLLSTLEIKNTWSYTSSTRTSAERGA